MNQGFLLVIVWNLRKIKQHLMTRNKKGESKIC